MVALAILLGVGIPFLIFFIIDESWPDDGGFPGS